MHTGDIPPPGYYTDPDNPRVQRWWDGAAWAVSSTGTVVTAPPAVAMPPAATTNPLATASLAFSIGWVFFVGSVLGVVLGHVAMAQIAASDGTQTGRGSAMIGLIVGYIGIACGLLLALILAG